MPQMAPMPWIMLMLYTMMIFLIISSIIFFFSSSASYKILKNKQTFFTYKW